MRERERKNGEWNISLEDSLTTGKKGGNSQENKGKGHSVGKPKAQTQTQTQTQHNQNR